MIEKIPVIGRFFQKDKVPKKIFTNKDYLAIKDARIYLDRDLGEKLEN